MPAATAVDGGFEITYSTEIDSQELLPRKSVWCNRYSLAGVVFSALAITIITLVITLYQVEYEEPSQGTKLAFTLEDFLTGRFTPNQLNASWISDTTLMYLNEEDGVSLFDASTQQSEVLLSTAQAPLLKHSFLQELSADAKFLLLGYDYQKRYRYSFLAKYSVVNLDTKTISPLVAPDGTELLQLVKWSTKNNVLVLVHENNIFYKETADASTMHQLTDSGSPQLYNGVPDWVYEEEVFGTNEAIWFSSDGELLAYASFDDTRVPNMTFPIYGETSNLSYQYTQTYLYNYPKAGTSNPVVSLHTVDLAKAAGGNASPVLMKPPTTVGSDHILAAVTWSKADEVAAVWMNRVQSMFVVAAHQASVGDPNTILVRQERTGWVDLFVAPIFSAAGTRMLLVLPQDQPGGVGAYRHVTLITWQIGGGNPISVALTSGQFVVTKIVAWDEVNGFVYFLATNENDPAQQQVYSVKDSGNPETPKCLSCGVKISETRAACTYNSASFSTKSSYYTLSCNGPDVPGVLVLAADGTLIKIWETNEVLFSFMAVHTAPIKKRLFVDVAGGSKAYVEMLLPPDMDTSGKTKYPLLVRVYGGPDTTMVLDEFVGDWSMYLTTNRSFVHAVIDGHGAGLRGSDLMFSVYRQLGTPEVDDQISVTRYLQDMFPYIDKDRTAIWGRSYGGYVAGMALAKDETAVFRCGISEAPVTNWIYYDSIYTERYMGLPTKDDNLIGYAEADLNQRVENLGRNKHRYLLVHGTADDNVHYQQAMMLARMLERKDILFDQQSYPDEAHSLTGVYPHLYHTKEQFLNECMDILR